MKRLQPYLAEIDQLLTESQGDKNSYFHPALKNLGAVSLVVVREAIAPVIFRNAEQEITDIEFNGETWIRAVPNKFKYAERARALQILRAMKAGGRYPQNKTTIPKKGKPSDAFDLNTLVLGDSAMHDSRVLPVRAAVNYSDGLSLKPKYHCVEESFHNRAAEDGTLFDAEKKKNSDNLFTRHFIRPGTLMIQVLSTRGKVLPLIGLKHLLLSIGLAGSYGGQTSTTGTNIRSHFVGIYADKFEQPISSPYELIKALGHNESSDPMTVASVTTAVDQIMAPLHQTAITGAEIDQWLTALIDDFNQPGRALEQEYQEAASHVAELFDQWFGKG